MATLTARGRRRIAKGNFAVPERRAFPIHDLSHAKNALARSAGTKDAGRVRRAVERKYPSLKKGRK